MLIYTPLITIMKLKRYNKKCYNFEKLKNKNHLCRLELLWKFETNKNMKKTILKLSNKRNNTTVLLSKKTKKKNENSVHSNMNILIDKLV